MGNKILLSGGRCVKQRGTRYSCKYDHWCLSDNCVDGSCLPSKKGCKPEKTAKLTLPPNLHPTEQVRCPFLKENKDGTVTLELRDWVPAGLTCELTCNRGFTLVSENDLNKPKKTDADDKEEASLTWKCERSGWIDGPRYVGCKEQSCGKLTKEHFPSANVKKTEHEVLDAVLRRMLLRRLSSITDDLLGRDEDQTKWEDDAEKYFTEVVDGLKTIHSDVTNDVTGLFYASIPVLQELEDEEKILKQDKDEGSNKNSWVTEKIEKLKDEIENGENKTKIRKALLSPFCHEGKILGHNADAPSHTCSYVCEKGYVFRTGKSHVVEKTHLNPSYKPLKPINLMCSRGTLRVTPGVCVRIESMKKKPSVEVLETINLPNFIVDLPQDKKFAGARCQYDIEFAGEFRAQDIKSLTDCEQKCQIDKECLVYTYNKTLKSCKFSGYYYGAKNKKQEKYDKDLKQHTNVYVSGWGDCSDAANTIEWTKGLLNLLSPSHKKYKSFFEYNDIGFDARNPISQRLEYTKHVALILDLVDGLAWDAKGTPKKKVDYSDIEKTHTKLKPLRSALSLHSSVDLIKRLKKLVNEGISPKDKAPVNALVAAITLLKSNAENSKGTEILEGMNRPMCSDTVQIAKDQAWDFVYDIPFFTHSMHKDAEKREENRDRIEKSSYYKRITAIIEAAEIYLETYMMYTVFEDPLVQDGLRKHKLAGTVGAIGTIVTWPGKQYDRIRSILNLNCKVKNLKTGMIIHPVTYGRKIIKGFHDLGASKTVYIT
jgi:hypothetical protein